MSHQPLRQEKNCLNCDSTVPERYCPNCGQENIENRPSFHHLFTHFFADLFHYDSGFWKTMKTLLFKPGKIVSDYLAGKRKTYVEPAKLYIFVSFVAFFLPHFLPDLEEKEKDEDRVRKTLSFDSSEVQDYLKNGNLSGLNNITSVAQLDSLQNSLPEEQKMGKDEYQLARKTLEILENSVVKKEDGIMELDMDLLNLRITTKDGINFGPHYQNMKTLAQFDSIHNSLPPSNRLNWAFAKVARKAVELRERDSLHHENLMEKFREAFAKNIPKAIFVYLPIFAFFLWLVHGKKRWLYYDHGIFTLYFFSAILIFITLIDVCDGILAIPVKIFPATYNVFSTISFWLTGFTALYMIFYFFRGHHRVYQENAWISRIKCMTLLMVNFVILFFTLLIYTFFTFMIL